MQNSAKDPSFSKLISMAKPHTICLILLEIAERRSVFEGTTVYRVWTFRRN